MDDGYGSALDAPGARSMPRVFSSIERTELKWLWPNRIPLGKLTIIAGQPGLGKSLTSITLAAMVTTPESKWPDCHEYAPTGAVGLMGAEDTDSDTVRPRLEAAGADLEKVYSFPSMVDDGDRMRGFKLDTDMHLLEKWVSEIPDLLLLVIDPITSFMGGVDSHKVADVRGVLHPLADLAQRHGFAVLYVTHLNKSSGFALDKVSGSGAFVAAARSMLFVVEDPHDEERRLIGNGKNNLAPPVGAIAYRIQSQGDYPLQVFEGGFQDVDVREVVAEGPRKSNKTEEAIDWLKGELSNGADFANDLYDKATQERISRRTLERAKKKLGVTSFQANGAKSPWKWQL